MWKKGKWISKIEFLNNSNINLNKMEYTNSLTEYLLNQGILDDKSKDEFTNAYYSQEENQDANESQLFENTAVFTLAWFLKNLTSEQAFSMSEKIFSKWQEIEENTFYKKIQPFKQNSTSFEISNKIIIRHKLILCN